MVIYHYSLQNNNCRMSRERGRGILEKQTYQRKESSRLVNERHWEIRNEGIATEKAVIAKVRNRLSSNKLPSLETCHVKGHTLVRQTKTNLDAAFAPPVFGSILLELVLRGSHSLLQSISLFI